MKKQIKFLPATKFAEDVLPTPKPSKNFIPKWYSKTKILINDKDHGLAPSGIAPNTTMKACMPFLDALSIGYCYYLPVDLEIRKNYLGHDYYFRWRTEGDFISQHDKEQHPLLPAPVNGEDFVSKFCFEFIIRTPPGYSTFFTHPTNRHDLPFRTFSGVVDTDKYNLPIQFPFQLFKQNKEILIIEKGTPVCQFFPFKREDWDSKTEKYNEKEIKRKIFNFKSIIKSSYKKQVWVSKKYS
jgi:hypothetical protein